MNKPIRKALCVLALCATAQWAHAGQLEHIKARGTLVCGVLGTFAPFGYTDPSTRSLVGYDVDFCKAIATQLGVKAQVKPMSVAARIPELQQGRVDVLVAGLAYTRQRARQVAFSDSYYVGYDYLLVRKGQGLDSPSALSGKRVGVTDGGIVGSYVKRAVPGAVLVGYEDTPTAFAALVQGKVQAFIASEMLERRLLSKLGAASSRYQFIHPALGKEVWGVGVRKDAPHLLAAVNRALVATEQSGQAARIFNQWLGAGTLYKMQRDFRIQPMGH